MVTANSINKTIKDGGTLDGTALGVTTPAAGHFTTATATSFDGAYSVSVPGGWVSNLKMTLSAGVLTFTGANGSALSASNPAYAIMQSKSAPGALKKYTITDDMELTVSDMTGNRMGFTAGIAVTTDFPLFAYIVCNDDETNIVAMVSRLAARPKSCVLAQIGAPDDAVATGQQGFFCFKNIDETLYDENPALMIGSCLATIDAANAYTITDLTIEDGIGRFQQFKEFGIPQGQFGSATAVGYIWDNTGTAPSWSLSNYLYSINAFTGEIKLRIYLYGDGGTDGAGAVTSRLVIPFSALVYSGGGSGHKLGSGTINYAGGVLSSFQFNLNDNLNYANITSIAKNGSVQNSDFSSGGRILTGEVTYHPDPST